MERFAKNTFSVLGVLTLFFLGGCVAATLPQYLSDKNPYKKEFFADYDRSVEAVRAALEELGWDVAGEADPAVYERVPSPSDQRIILFSEIRQTPMFLGTRYAKLNVIVRSLQNKTEIEIRYVTVTSVVFRSLESYKNDAAVRRIFKRIASHIEE